MKFVLRHTSASGLLLPARFSQVIVQAFAPLDAAMKGQELRLTRALDPNDDACAGFILDFAGQGQRVETTANGPSATLLAWALHTLAATLKCDIESDVAPDREAAFAYLDTYEAEVLETRARREVDGAGFVAWLAREEHLALTEDSSLPSLELEDPAALYEALIESDAVDDVFVSERELTRLLARFKARVR